MDGKRKQEDDSMEFKRQKHLEVESQREDAVSIADLDHNCLMVILDLLRLNDLARLACVNKHLKEMVYFYLGFKCLDRSVSIYSSISGVWLWTTEISDKFVFANLAEVSAYLRMCGHLISHLSICCAENCFKDQYKKVEKSVFENCSFTLTKFKVTSALLPVMTELTKPLPNVTELELDGCELSANLCANFNILFPSVRRLVLKDCKAIDPKCIEVEFKHLKELIVFGYCQNRMVFTKDNIKAALRLNPQIRQLTVDFNSKSYRHVNNNEANFDLGFDFYRFVNESLPKLVSLEVYGHVQFHALYGTQKTEKSHFEGKIEFGTLKKLTVDCIYGQRPDEIAPFSFKCLQELNLHDMNSFTDEWFNFITQNNGLVKLTIDVSNEKSSGKRANIKRSDLLAIVMKLPELQELHLRASSLEPKDVYSILRKRKTLMTICLRNHFAVDDIIETYDGLVAKKKWRVNYDSQNLKLERIVS